MGRGKGDCKKLWGIVRVGLVLGLGLGVGVEVQVRLGMAQVRLVGSCRFDGVVVFRARGL